MPTTLGREIIRTKLPDKYKSYADRVLDKKVSDALMTAIAEEDPDGYIDVLQDLNNVAQTVVSSYGRDAALPFDDMLVSKGIMQVKEKMQALVNKVLDDDSLTPAQKEDKIKELGYKYTQKIEDAVFDDNDKRRTALASQIKSGARGKKVQLMQMLFGNMLMKDALNRDMPYLGLDAYADGVTPTNYWVSSSSGRKGYYDVQAATGQSGYLGKRVTAATHDTIISEEDCGTTDTGVPYPANSDKNIGAVLLRPFHNHPAGSIVDAKMVAEADDDEEMIVRSPMTCKSKNGVCAKCNGLGENGLFPGIGEYVSLNAARSFVEPLTQASIGCLAPDTMVRMADWSTKQIKDICVGDKVIGVSVDGIPTIVNVTRTYVHGDMPMYSWTYRNGKSQRDFLTLVATENHKALQCTHEKAKKRRGHEFDYVSRILPLGEKSYKISMIPIQHSICIGNKHIEEALFIGLMLGDGCYTAGAELRPFFSCADDSLIEETKAYMESLKLKFVKRKNDKYGYRVVGTEQYNVIGEPIRVNPAKQLLRAHDLMGLYANEKALPADFRLWDNASLSALISGLIITDGSIGFFHYNGEKPFVSFCSCSYKLVKQVQEAILIGCGARSIACTGYIKEGKRECYTLTYANNSETMKLVQWLKLYGVKEQKRLACLNALADWEKTADSKQTVWRCDLVAKSFVGMICAYDIEVDHPDHLFLLANGLIVSNSKHSGGVGGKRIIDPEGEDQPTGFRNIERMFTTPSNFPGGAVLAPEDGTVTMIKPAAQGGTYITVGTKTLYCNPYRTMKVKVGDKVYAGDVLTNGVPNPMEVVSLKGLGAGRVYFMNKLNDILKDSGAGTSRRNVESFARAFLNKVEITNPDGYDDYLPGDIVNYSNIMADYEPREGSQKLPADKAINQYLEQPVLYYTIGTRITPEVAANLKKYNFNDVLVHKDQPAFAAKFMRPAEGLQHDKHWLPRLSGERLKEGLFDAARQGITDEYDSNSYVDKIIIEPLKPQ